MHSYGFLWIPGNLRIPRNPWNPSNLRNPRIPTNLKNPKNSTVPKFATRIPLVSRGFLGFHMGPCGFLGFHMGPYGQTKSVDS